MTTKKQEDIDRLSAGRLHHPTPQCLRDEKAMIETFAAAMRQRQNELLLSEQQQQFWWSCAEDRRAVWRAVWQHGGLVPGFVTSLVTLVGLRQGPKLLTRFLLSSSSYYYSTNANTTTTLTLRHVRNSPFAPKNNNNNSNNSQTLVNAGWWMIDGLLSLAVGISVAGIYTNQAGLLKQVADIPLQSGRSQISDTYCPVVWNVIQNSIYAANNDSNDDSDSSQWQHCEAQESVVAGSSCSYSYSNNKEEFTTTTS